MYFTHNISYYKEKYEMSKKKRTRVNMYFSFNSSVKIKMKDFDAEKQNL